jgi:hypothetical protein
MMGKKERRVDSSEVLLYNPGRDGDSLKGISSGGDKKWRDFMRHVIQLTVQNDCRMSGLSN